MPYIVVNDGTINDFFKHRCIINIMCNFKTMFEMIAQNTFSFVWKIYKIIYAKMSNGCLIGNSDSRHISLVGIEIELCQMLLSYCTILNENEKAAWRERAMVI